MKRFLTIALAVLMALTAGTGAFAVSPAAVQPAGSAGAGNGAEAELTAVTEKVAALLDVADDYTDFTGNYSSGPDRTWDLYWSKQGEDLSVRGTPDGLITQVNYWRNNDSGDRFYGFDPAFPKLGEAEAEKQAKAWLEKLMGENESFRIDDTVAPLSAGGEYSFEGRVLKNGLESPVTFAIRIGGAGLSSYSRSDSWRGFVGGLPSAEPAARKQQAAQLLKDAVAFELYYVTDGDAARLRYVPVGANTVVDALTGEAVDMDALYENFGSSYTEPEAPMAEAAMAKDMATGNGRSLTEVELRSIENYADALPQEQLDAGVRAVAELGLEGFDLTRCRYVMDTDGNITASLRYTCEMTENRLFGYTEESLREHLSWGERPVAMKYIELDGKTGELRSVSTSYSLWEREAGKAPDTETAESFLRKAAPERFAESALCTLKCCHTDGVTLTYARMHEGYFFPENTLTVTMNTATNTVDEYSCRWDDNKVFAEAEGIVSEAGALEAYTNAMTVTLGYTAWPMAIDYNDPVLFAYADWGWSYVETLRLAYYYSGKDRLSGVDALTGEPVVQAPEGGFVYTDLAGVPQREYIEALAACGVGLPGSAFRAGKGLTMADAARLLLSAAGMKVSDWDDDTLRDQAIWQGFVTADGWTPSRVVTQAEFVTMLLSASRYGDAAALPAIGYESVAQALGMIGGAMPAGPCTRGDGAELLYRFMKR